VGQMTPDDLVGRARTGQVDALVPAQKKADIADHPVRLLCRQPDTERRERRAQAFRELRRCREIAGAAVFHVERYSALEDCSPARRASSSSGAPSGTTSTWR